jgi:hypothetical protein
VENLFFRAQTLKLIIESSDKIYRAIFITFIISISSGWYITRFGEIKNEFRRIKIRLIALILFFSFDMFITDKMYQFYIIPLKNILGFLLFYVTVMGYTRKITMMITVNNSTL